MKSYEKIALSIDTYNKANASKNLNSIVDMNNSLIEIENVFKRLFKSSDSDLIAQNQLVLNKKFNIDKGNSLYFKHEIYRYDRKQGDYVINYTIKLTPNFLYGFNLKISGNFGKKYKHLKDEILNVWFDFLNDEVL